MDEQPKYLLDPNSSGIFSFENLIKINNYLIKNEDTRRSLDEFSVDHFKNTALLAAIYNSHICVALYLIHNRKILKIDVNKRHELQRAPLHTAILKGYKRCLNNCNCDSMEDLAIACNEILENISKTNIPLEGQERYPYPKCEVLNMGCVIESLLLCPEIDILLQYYDDKTNNYYNAIDLALLVFDYDTINSMYIGYTRKTFVDYVNSDSIVLKEILSYYDKDFSKIDELFNEAYFKKYCDIFIHKFKPHYLDNYCSVFEIKGNIRLINKIINEIKSSKEDKNKHGGNIYYYKYRERKLKYKQLIK